MDIEDAEKVICKKFKPCVPMYGPINIKDLEVGQVKLWCTCGRSKKQPWCDQSHKGTPFKPLKWVVPGTKKDGQPQSLYSICNCKYTQDPPYCDATHIHLPLIHKKQQDSCSHKDQHQPNVICDYCGYNERTE